MNSHKKSEKETLEKALTKLLSEKKEAVVISLTGSWGIGKTSFWNDFANKKFKANHRSRKYAYVSLFGINSVEEIRNKIALQIYPHNKKVAKIREIVGSSKFNGVSLGGFINIAYKGDFENVIVCFDDFERLSSSLDIKDVMGLISELKEQLNCKIVIINNNDQLKQSDLSNQKTIFQVKKNADKNNPDSINLEEIYRIKGSNNKETYDTYSEKIIDYELCYRPTIKENYNLIKQTLKFKDYDKICGLLEEYSSRDNSSEEDTKFYNIRSMYRLIAYLNTIAFVNHLSVNSKIINSIIYFFLKYAFNIEEDRFSFYPYKPNLVSIDTLKPYLEEVIKYSIIKEQTAFQETLKHLNTIVTENEEISQVHVIGEKYDFDLKYTNKKFSEELFAIFSKFKNTIIKYLGIDNFNFFFTQLLEANPNNKDSYEEFFIEAAKLYIDGFVDSESYVKDEYGLPASFNKYDELKCYYNKKLEDMTKSITNDPQLMSETMNRIRTSRGWNKGDEVCLDLVSSEDHVKYSIKSSIYLRDIVEFLRWINRFSNRPPFEGTKKNIEAALISLYEIKEYKLKVERLLKLVKVDIPEENYSRISP